MGAQPGGRGARIAKSGKRSTSVQLGPEPSGLQGVDRVNRLLDAVAEGHSSLTRIAAEAGLSDATALRYLSSLVEHGLLERNSATRHYRMGMRMFLLGRKAISGRDFIAVANGCLARLVDLVDETANLGARVGDDVIVIHAVESTQPIRKGASVGERDEWHASGLGKAMLSTLDSEEIKRILTSRGTPKLTKHSMTSATTIRTALKTITAQGYAVDDEESVEGLRCVAVPIRNHAGTSRYAISVSGPTYRLTTKRIAELIEPIQQEAAILEAFLDHSTRPTPQ